MFSTLSVLNFTAVEILCTSAVKLCYAKSINSLFMCCHVAEFIEAVRISILLISHSGKLLQQKLHCKIRDIDHLKCVPYIAEFDKSEHNKMSARPTAKNSGGDNDGKQ